MCTTNIQAFSDSSGVDMFINGDGNVSYNERYQHKVAVPGTGIHSHTLEWCTKRCTGKCGWHFEGDQSYMSFENCQDAVLWSLRWAEYYETERNRT